MTREAKKRKMELSQISNSKEVSKVNLKQHDTKMPIISSDIDIKVMSASLTVSKYLSAINSDASVEMEMDIYTRKNKDEDELFFKGEVIDIDNFSPKQDYRPKNLFPGDPGAIIMMGILSKKRYFLLKC